MWAARATQGQGTSTGRTALGLRKVLAMLGGKERWQEKSKESRREENGEEEEDWEGRRRGPCHFIDSNPATFRLSVGINGKYTTPAAHHGRSSHRVTPDQKGSPP